MNSSQDIITFENFKQFNNTQRFYIQEFNGKAYVFDQYPGEIFNFEEPVSRLIFAKNEEEFKKFKSEIDSEELEVEEQFIGEIFNFENKPADSPHSKKIVSHLKLNLSSACNLDCAYCFKDPKARRFTDLPKVEKALDYMMSDCGSEADARSVGLNLSGEPLLDLTLLRDVKKIVLKKEKQYKKDIGFFYITNGTIGTPEAIKTVKKTRNDPYILISIDGPKEVHDKMRRTNDNSGSYDLIMDNLKIFKKKKFQLKSESVLTSHFPNPMDVALHLIDLGFERINMKPIRQGAEGSFDMDSIEELKKGYAKYFELLTEELLEGNFFLLRVLTNDYGIKFLPRILFGVKMKLRCFWGIHNYSMDENGDYYPCDAVMGMEQFKVGSIEEGIDWEKFHKDLDCEKRGECVSCWARHICGGTCHVNTIMSGKDMMDIDPVECSLNKFLVESNVKMVARLMDGGVDLNGIKYLLTL